MTYDILDTIIISITYVGVGLIASWPVIDWLKELAKQRNVKFSSAMSWPVYVVIPFTWPVVYASWILSRMFIHRSALTTAVRWVWSGVAGYRRLIWPSKPTIPKARVIK